MLHVLHVCFMYASSCKRGITYLLALALEMLASNQSLCRVADQVEVCFTSLSKAAVVLFLRLISLIVLGLLQLPEELFQSCK